MVVHKENLVLISTATTLQVNGLRTFIYLFSNPLRGIEVFIVQGLMFDSVHTETRIEP